MVKRQIEKPVGRKRGQATVEFTLALIFILLPLLMGVAEVARIYSEQLAVVHAAGVGARWASLDADQRARTGYNDSQLCDLVAADLGRSLSSGTEIDVTANLMADNQYRVNVTYPHNYFFGLLTCTASGCRDLPLPGSFTARATMPVQQEIDPLPVPSGVLNCEVP